MSRTTTSLGSGKNEPHYNQPWIRQCRYYGGEASLQQLLSRDASVVPDALAFLTEQGRMKYVRPLYKALHAWPEQREKAVETFVANRSNYHPIAAKMLAQDLQISTAEGDA